VQRNSQIGRQCNLNLHLLTKELASRSGLFQLRASRVQLLNPEGISRRGDTWLSLRGFGGGVTFDSFPQFYEGLVSFDVDIRLLLASYHVLALAHGEQFDLTANSLTL
jgi:hypothetical protein